MGIPPGPSEGSEVHRALPLLLSRGLSRHTTPSTPSGGMPGRAGGVAPGGRTATHMESTLYLRLTCSGRRMTQMGQVRRAPSMGREVGLRRLELPSVNYRAAGRG